MTNEQNKYVASTLDFSQPVSSIMSTDLKAVSPEDPVRLVKDIIYEHKIHHVPVVEKNQLVGIVSALDLLYFMRLIDKESNAQYINELRLKNYKVKEIMFKAPEYIAPTSAIMDAIKVFSENVFHALPVVEGNSLVGIITTHDIVKFCKV